MGRIKLLTAKEIDRLYKFEKIFDSKGKLIKVIITKKNNRIKIR